ncbi:hypothetical protein predicted by Glimmer/Critica [Sorangium cellulosum So ce56]|uniref:Uncharacterized protein n=1 Tax=Sorangium cellulosum (strain So ce56) TaxID=448385 RepID=A9FQ29_SORC5|nr:hypothetical protein predicted by Glimmer/Critica [Sorangium cellulosum So ce56]
MQHDAGTLVLTPKLAVLQTTRMPRGPSSRPQPGTGRAPAMRNHARR